MDLVPNLTAQVQRNCDISDAHFAGDYTLCTYLLKMREFFRWERGYRLTDRLPKQEVGSWLQEREQRWAALDGVEYQPIAIDGAHYAPFESAAINRVLLPHGLIYSGGYGAFGKPHFFLAQLEQREQRHGHQVVIAGAELARDLTAPPAMLQQDTIYVRRESVRRMVWERIEEWQVRQGESPMARAAHHHGFAEDAEAALTAMTQAEIATIILHEEGEQLAGEQLGGDWERLLIDISRSKAEYLARAVRDHLADTVTTLPSLVATGNRGAIHLYMANLTGLRRDLFPSLMGVYNDWLESGAWEPWDALIASARPHWEAMTQELLALWRELGAAAGEQIVALLPRMRL